MEDTTIKYGKNRGLAVLQRLADHGDAVGLRFVHGKSFQVPRRAARGESFKKRTGPPRGDPVQTGGKDGDRTRNHRIDSPER